MFLSLDTFLTFKILMIDDNLTRNENIVGLIEQLLADSEYRIGKADDVYTSNEVNRENIQLAKKNIKEIAILQGLLHFEENGNIEENYKVRVAAAQEAVISLRERVDEHSMIFLGHKNWDVSSLDGSYDHITNREETPSRSPTMSEDSSRIPA